MTFSTIRKSAAFLLRPVARALWWYIALVAVRELVRIGGNYSMSATFRFLEFLDGHDRFWYWAAFLGGLALYGELSVRIHGAAFWQITARVNTPLFQHMRASAFRKFLALPVEWHQRHNSAAMAGEVNNGIEQAHEIFDAAAWQLLPLVTATLLSLVPLLWFSPRSAVALAIGGGLFVWLNYRIYRETERFRVGRCDWLREDWKLTGECVRALPAVLMANRTAAAEREYDAIQDQISHNTIEDFRYEVFRHGRWRDRVVAWTHVALIAIWLQQLRAHTLTLIDCVYLWRICEDVLVYMENYSAFFEQVAGNTESLKRYLRFLDEPEPVKAVAAAAAAPAPGSIHIDLRDVSFHYAGQDRCLDGVSAVIRPGEVVAIVGATGSGKSTLAKLICGLFDPAGGDILFNGRSIRDWWSPAQVRSLVSYVPQLNEASVFERSIAENIRFAVPDAPLEKVVDAAKAAGFHEDVMRLPDGYDTIVGEDGCTLSGGQVQRLVLARELLKDAPVFLFDEPSSAQDPLTERRILDAVLPRMAGKTVILISHRLELVRSVAGRVLVVDGGRIAESGAYYEMVNEARDRERADILSACAP